MGPSTTLGELLDCYELLPDPNSVIASALVAMYYNASSIPLLKNVPDTVSLIASLFHWVDTGFTRRSEGRLK